MKNLIKDFTEKVYEVFFVILFVGGVLFTLCLYLKMLEPLWPVTTLLFVIFITCLGLFGSRKSALLSIVGIIAYAFSWTVTKDYGIIPGMTMCTTGIVTWMYAAYSGFGPDMPKKLHA